MEIHASEQPKATLGFDLRSKKQRAIDNRKMEKIMAKKPKGKGRGGRGC